MFAFMSISTMSIMICLSVALLLAASLHDIAARTIPNRICAALVLIGIGLRIADHSLREALFTGFVVLAVMTACRLRGWLGGGDVKLLTAVALVLPPSLVPACMVWIGIAGGLLALGYIVLRRLLVRLVPAPSFARPSGRLARIGRAELFRIRRGGPLPYGVGIAAGAIAMLLTGAA